MPLPDAGPLPPTPHEVTLDEVEAEARACTLCAAVLPLGPRPILRVSPTARLLIASQAPGTKVHVSGTPWTDASGERLRRWLGLDLTAFHDPVRVAILPTGFCYPGRLPAGGDAPPRPECAPLWHPRLLPLMPELRLTLLVGGYAQARALGPGTMTERVRGFREFLPRYFPLPHPSWRTEVWERRNPWFAADVLPVLRQEVGRALDSLPVGSARSMVVPLPIHERTAEDSMSDQPLGKRGKALEDAFFARQDEALRQRLRDADDAEQKRAAFAAASGIADPAVLDRLAAMNIGSDTLAALSLVPVVMVAWADGGVDGKERAAALAAAAEAGLEKGSASYQLLDQWLAKRPPPELLATWKDYIQAVSAGMGSDAKLALKSELLARARRIAEAAGGFLGIGSKVSAAEQAVLDDLGTAFR